MARAARCPGPERLGRLAGAREIVLSPLGLGAVPNAVSPPSAGWAADAALSTDGAALAQSSGEHTHPALLNGTAPLGLFPHDAAAPAAWAPLTATPACPSRLPRLRLKRPLPCRCQRLPPSSPRPSQPTATVAPRTGEPSARPAQAAAQPTAGAASAPRTAAQAASRALVTCVTRKSFRPRRPRPLCHPRPRSRRRARCQSPQAGCRPRRRRPRSRPQ